MQRPIGSAFLVSTCLTYGLLAACTGDRPTGLMATPVGTGPAIVWDLDAKPLPEIPFPNDVATRMDTSSPTGRRVNVSEEAPTENERQLRRSANLLDGFGTYAPISVRFDAPLDLPNIIARHRANKDFADDTVLLLNIQQYNNPLLIRNVSYKPSDFIPIAAGGILTLVMATAKTLPVKNAREFIEYARANPGKLNYGYWGVGGSPHLMATRLEAVSGIKLEGIGYKDPAQATTDLASGRIHLFFTSATHGLTLMQAGQANIVAVGTPQRMAKLPDVPTFVESGVQGMPSPWWGYAAPAGTPPEVIARLERAFRAAMATPRYQQLLVDNASAPLVLESPARFSEFIERETERWAAAIRPLNLKLE